MKRMIQSKKAPAAIGPYSQAIEKAGMIFVSGQLPILPETGQFPSEDVKDQTKASLENIRGILEEAGVSFEDVVKVNVYLADINDFGAMNEIYGQYFQAPYPARAAFAVAGLPKNAKVEIEVTAVR